ncbi:MAG: SRPBCC domain-containing protein [Acidimicrobiales bacterium]
MHLTREVLLPVSCAEAWELLSEPDELARWLGAPRPFALRPGATTTLTEPDGTSKTLVFDDVRVGEHIGFTWWSDVDGPSTASHVELVVEAATGGSLVTVTETAAPSASPRASVAGGVRRLPIGAGWDARLVDLELRALLRQAVTA